MVVAAMQLHASAGEAPLWPVLRYVLFEAGVLALLAAAQRGLSVQQALLRVLLGQKVNTLILEKAQTLSLSQFEDPSSTTNSCASGVKPRHGRWHW